MLDEEKVKLTKLLQDTDESTKIKREDITYEKFLNFFQNASTKIKNTENRHVIDEIIRMVFLNFRIGNNEVVSVQLKPMFEKFIKIPPVSNGDESGT